MSTLLSYNFRLFKVLGSPCVVLGLPNTRAQDQGTSLRWPCLFFQGSLFLEFPASILGFQDLFHATKEGLENLFVPALSGPFPCW